MEQELRRRIPSRRLEINTLKDNIVCSGALFYAKSTKKILLLQKSNGKHRGTWSLVGGTVEAGENAWQSLVREIKEEIGDTPHIIKSMPLETFVSNDKVFHFHTFLCVVDKEFIPTMSNEHCGYSWTTIDLAPKPLHQGLRSSFNNKNIRNKLETIFKVMDLI
ncbi:NUDIX hydrolase [bacterium]|nr:NUDIX hydrolase [Candidatus Elulimicrobium humile]